MKPADIYIMKEAEPLIPLHSGSVFHIIINMNITKKKKTVKDEMGMGFRIHELKDAIDYVKFALRLLKVVGSTGFSVPDISVSKQNVKRVDHRPIQYTIGL